jgi:type IX secretion system PorP/SprF family membrane protein
MMAKITSIALLAMLISFQGFSQDFHFSQFYASPLNLNPALTGSTELTRVGINYRKQWPGLSYDFNAYSAYFDHYSYDLNSGFGIMVNSFQEANMQINTSDISFLYSYNLQVAESWNFRFGGQGAWVRRSAKLDNLLFGDQVDLFNRTVNQNSIDQIPDFEPNGYLDFSFGALVNNDMMWLGASAHHINQPNLSFFPDNEAGVLPMKWSVHGGVNFPLGASDYFGSKFDNQISILANYKQQGPFQQLDMAVQALYGNVIGGLGYRGIPGLRNTPNQDSIILMLGVNLENGLVIGYSYDFMISNIGYQTRGAHEVSIRYQFLLGDPRSRNQKSRVMRCFKYMM